MNPLYLFISTLHVSSLEKRSNYAFKWHRKWAISSTVRNCILPIFNSNSHIIGLLSVTCMPYYTGCVDCFKSVEGQCISYHYSKMFLEYFKWPYSGKTTWFSALSIAGENIRARDLALSPPPPWNWSRMPMVISSVEESQKGVITIQRCSVENQKGTITVQRCSVENQKGTITVQNLWP